MRTSINETDVRRLYQDEGMSLRNVAKELGVSLATLSRFMKKVGIQTRDKATAQKNYLKDNEHQMAGRTHTEETKQKISQGLGEFWDSLSPEASEELRQRIGSGWKRKWESMSEAERHAMMSELSAKSRLSQGNGSRLERFIAEELRSRGFIVEERTTNYTIGKDMEVDLALPSQGIAIEVDGPTHFLPIYGEDHLAQQQERDGRKDQQIIDAGYSVLRIRDNNGPLSQLRMERIVSAINDIIEDGGQSVWYVE